MYFSNYNFINNRFFCGGIKVTRNFKWVTISLSFWAYSGITVLYSNLSKHDLTRNIREDLPACWSQLRPRLDKLRGCTLSTFHNTAESPSTTDRSFCCICWLLFEAHCFCFWVFFPFHCRHHRRNFIKFIATNRPGAQFSFFEHWLLWPTTLYVATPGRTERIGTYSWMA